MRSILTFMLAKAFVLVVSGLYGLAIYAVVVVISMVFVDGHAYDLPLAGILGALYGLTLWIRIEWFWYTGMAL